MPLPYRVVFMGCPDFAVPVLQALAIDSDFEIEAVYSMPDKPRGRGNQTSCTSVKKCALELGFPVFTPSSLRKDPAEIDRLKSFSPDFLVVVAYGMILPAEALAIPAVAAVNLHASLLPRHRGPSPIHNAILAGDQKTGNCIMLMNERMDEGDILAIEETSISPADTLATLHDRLCAMGAPLMISTLKGFAEGSITPRKQDHLAATYTAKINTETARIDWSRPALEIERQVRAMSPFPGPWFEYNGIRFKVGKSAVEEGTGVPFGRILESDSRRGLKISCGDGTSLRILEIQRPGGGMIPATDFLRGFKFFGDSVIG